MPEQAWTPEPWHESDRAGDVPDPAALRLIVEELAEGTECAVVRWTPAPTDCPCIRCRARRALGRET